MAKYFTKDGDEFKAVEATLFTQEEIDTNIIPKRLERERSKFADYDTLKEKAGKVDTITSEFESKLKEKDTLVSTLTNDVSKAKLETSKVKIATEFKLSDELSEFVTGETPEEMRQRAEKLSKGIGTSGFKIDKDKKPDDKGTDSTKIARSLLGGNKSDD
jgi:hypothetical protein